MTTQAEEMAAAGAARRKTNPIYAFLTSMKVGVILLLILTAACVLGTMVPQNQPVEVYLEHYGKVFGGFFLRTGLSHVFSSWWFNTLAGVFGLSLLMCSWRRLKAQLRQAQPEVQSTLERLKAMKSFTQFTMPLSGEETEQRLSGWLKKVGYRVHKESAGSAVCLLARKGSISQWGTLLVHVSLLIILVGALYGNMPSIGGLWESRLYNAEAPLKEGEKFTVALPESKPFQIELIKAEREMSPEGMPTAFRSQVRVWQDGKTVKEGLIEMNRPVYYQGVSMTMSQYFAPEAEAGGTDLKLLVKAPGAAEQEVPIPLVDGPEGLAVDMMSSITTVQANGWTVFAHSLFEAPLEGSGLVALGPNGKPRAAAAGEKTAPALSVFVVEDPKQGMSGWKPVGYVGPQAELDYKGVKFRLKVSASAGGSAPAGAVLSLRRDPGVPIVYLGFGVLMVGVMLAFYISQRTVRARLWTEKSQTKVALGVRSRGGLAWAEAELEKVRAALGK